MSDHTAESLNLSSRKELVLHIGLPKCGSTSLQRFFAANTDRLAEADITYLPASRTREIRAMAAGKDPLGSLAQQVENARTQICLLSSEYLTGAPKAIIQSTVEGLAAVVETVTVVIVLRPLVGWLESYDNQDGKELKGLRTNVKSFVEADKKKPPKAPPLPEWLDTWTNNTIPIDPSPRFVYMPLFGESPLPSRFMESIGHPIDVETWSEVDAHLNQSVSVEALGVMESVNRLADLLRSRLGLANIRDDMEIYTHLKNIASGAMEWSSATRPETRHLLTPERAARLANEIRSSLSTVLGPTTWQTVEALLAEPPTEKRAAKQK